MVRANSLFRAPLFLIFAIVGYGQQLDDNNVPTVVFIGTTGVGKSESANTIVNKKKSMFEVASGFFSKTAKVQKAVAKPKVEDAKLVFNVLDVPGLVDTAQEEEALDKKLHDLVYYAERGIDVLALTLEYRRFNKHDFKSFNAFMNLFDLSDTAAKKYIMVVITKAGKRQEDEIRDEISKGCSWTSSHYFCELWKKLDLKTQLVVFGDLEDERRKRDRKQFFQVATAMLRYNAYEPYDGAKFLSQTKERRKEFKSRMTEVSRLSQRVADDWKDKLRDLLDGAASDDQFEKMLQQAESDAKLEWQRREKLKEESDRRVQELREKEGKQAADMLNAQAKKMEKGEINAAEFEVTLNMLKPEEPGMSTEMKVALVGAVAAVIAAVIGVCSK